MINTTENNNHKIFINNLPEKYSVSELNDLCKDYGKIEKSVKILVLWNFRMKQRPRKLWLN